MIKDDVIKEQSKTRIVEPVPDKATDNRIHYIPHHGVWKRDAKTTQLRLVYDASEKERKRDRLLRLLFVQGSYPEIFFKLLETTSCDV